MADGEWSSHAGPTPARRRSGRESGTAIGACWAPGEPLRPLWGVAPSAQRRAGQDFVSPCGENPQPTDGFGLFCGIVPQDPPLVTDYPYCDLGRAPVIRGRLHSFRFFVIPGASPSEGRPVAVMTAAKADRRDELLCATGALAAGGARGIARGVTTAGGQVAASSGRVCSSSRSAAGSVILRRPILALRPLSAARRRRDNSAQRLRRDHAVQPRTLTSGVFLNKSKFTIG